MMISKNYSTPNHGIYKLIFGVMLIVFSTVTTAKSEQSLTLKADLRADVNRDGEIYLGAYDIEMEDKTGQTHWTLKRGAIVLPNIDDDADRCNENLAIQDISVTACNDAKDLVINGDEDFSDLAPLRLMPWVNAPKQAFGIISIGSKAQEKARLFIQRNDGWQVLNADTRLTASELRLGVNLKLEALDVVRDRKIWDGRVDVVAQISDGKSTVEDRVQFHVAPMVLQSDLMRIKRLYLPGMPWAQDGVSLSKLKAPTSLNQLDSNQLDQSEYAYLSILDAANPMVSDFSLQRRAMAKLGPLGSAYKAFYDDFVIAASSAQKNTRIVKLTTNEDPWVQDLFEMAYTAMPKAKGKMQILHIAIRAAQPQRITAQIPLIEVLGPNVGIVEQWSNESGITPKNGDFSLNSSGNFGTVPPYIHNNKLYPLGRILYGAGETWVRTGIGIIDSGIAGGEYKMRKRQPDTSFMKMLAAQGLQKPLVIDTAWLAVGHIDEIVAFVPVKTDRGWKIVVADPNAAWAILKDITDKGMGSTKFLSGLDPWAIAIEPEQLERTVDDIVKNPKLERAQKVTQAKISGVIKKLKDEIGIQDKDIIRVPVLFKPAPFNERNFIALMPNAANLVVLGNQSIAVAKQHGPLIDGKDVFEKAIVDAFEPTGLSVSWVEDYIQAHIGDGEIHCQSNMLRDPGGWSKWWQPVSNFGKAIDYSKAVWQE